MAGPRAPFLLAPQGFWVRLLSYIMETDALTPICASLTCTLSLLRTLTYKRGHRSRGFP